MTAWHQLLCDSCHRDYALCAEDDEKVLCRKLPKTAKIEERFLWSYIGGALVSKATGMVLEASPDLNKPLFLRNASTPLRPSQTWKIDRSGSMITRNGRMMMAILRSEPGSMTVIGTQYGGERQPDTFIRWRFFQVSPENVGRVDIQLSRPAMAPMQKMAPSLQMSVPQSPNPLASPSQPSSTEPNITIPGDDDIGPKELLFDLDFYKERLSKEQNLAGMDDRKIEEEWNNNGIQNGRWGSPAFDVKFYLARNEQLRQRIAPDNYKAAVEYFLNHIDEPIQTSDIFNWTVYRQYGECKHLTPKQLFVHFNRIGSRHGVVAA